jgi:hypothetical protein
MRRALWEFENPSLRISVAPGGGHIAGLYLKKGHPRAKRLPNPLWTPPWKSIEPTAYKPRKHDRVYGGAPEGPLLSGILGHNLALDTFGTPSAAEVRAGGLTHGEAGVTVWKRKGVRGFGARLPEAQLEVSREIIFHRELPVARVRTRVNNVSCYDRPIAWNEHVSFGPPFLAPHTEFSLPARRALVFPADMGPDSQLEPGREFVWPNAPLRDGRTIDHQFPPRAKRASDFTTQLFETPSNLAWFTATNPKLDLAVGYLFHRSDFPWIGIWDEKMGRAAPPWNRRTYVRGMEFSTTPMPGSRRQMIDQGKMFGAPSFRWVEALGSIEAVFVLYMGAANNGDLQEQALRFLNTEE